MADQRLTNFLVLFGTFFLGDVYIIDKLMAVPTARVARKARSPTFSTGLQLVPEMSGRQGDNDKKEITSSDELPARCPRADVK